MVSDNGFSQYTSLPARAGVGRNQAVPMIGHDDDYGIDIFVIQQPAIIVVGGTRLGIRLFRPVFGLGQARGIDFAHGDGVFQILAHVLAAFVAARRCSR